MATFSRWRFITIFAIVGAVVSWGYYSALQQGSFVRWIPLGKPSTAKVTKVIWVDYVETASGDLYHYEGEWVKAEEVSSSPRSSSWIPLNECLDFYSLPSLDKFLDSKMACERFGEDGLGMHLTITAIDGAGKVYSWRHGIGELEGRFIGFATVAGAIRGFLVAIPVLWIIGLVRWLKKQ